MGVLFVGGIGAAIWFFVWANRSDSPRAARIRHLLGGSEKKREDRAKTILWFGEEKVLRREAAKAFATDLRLPPFYLKGETIVEKGLFSGSDIDFADDAAFSDRYHLASSDEVAVRTLFTPDVRRAFVEAGNCHLECVSSTLTFRELEQTTVRGYELFVDDSLKLYRAMTRMIRARV